MKEVIILRTVELHSRPGVVHIKSIGYDSEETTHIEYDAYALLQDIPSLYRIARQAIEQDKKWEYKKFEEFGKLLAKDLKSYKKPEK